MSWRGKKRGRSSVLRSRTAVPQVQSFALMIGSSALAGPSVCGFMAQRQNELPQQVEAKDDGADRDLDVGELHRAPRHRTMNIGERDARIGLLVARRAHPVRQSPVVDVVPPVSYTHLRAHETPEHLVCR